MPTSATTRLGPPAAARRRHTYQDMARYAAPPTASPRPSASFLVITTPAPCPLRARGALTVTSRRPWENVCGDDSARFSGCPWGRGPRRPGARGPRRRRLSLPSPLSVGRTTVIAVTEDPYELAGEAAGA